MAGTGPTAAWAQQLMRSVLASTDPGALDTAIAQVRSTLAGTPPGDPDRTTLLSLLADFLHVRYQRAGRMPDLNDVIEVGEATVAAMPAGHEARALTLSNLAGALGTRYEREGRRRDLDRSIEAGEAAVAAIPADDPGWVGPLSNLGVLVLMRYQAGGALADLDRAVAIGEAVVAAGPAGNDGGHLHNLASALYARTERLGELADLDRAVATGESAVAATPAGHPQTGVRLSVFGLALRLRAERLGGLPDLDRAIDVGEAAVAATPPEHPGTAMVLANLGIALQIRAERLGSPEDLDRAIEAGEAAVAAGPPGHLSRTQHLANLAVQLRIRYERRGSPADLDRAIELNEAAVAATAAGHPNRAMFLSNLAGSLRIRSERTGHADDLERAIDLSDAAVAATPPDHPNRAVRLAGLAAVLLLRYQGEGGLAALDRAIEIGEAAVAAIPADHPNRPMFLSNLAAALSHRVERSGQPDDLDRAIEVGEAAVAATPVGHPNRIVRAANLTLALRNRFEFMGRPADLDRAIEIGEAAIAAAPSDDPNRAGCLANLGTARFYRFERGADPADLDRAIEAGEAAVAGTPPDHPTRALRQMNLGLALRARHQRTRARSDRDRAVTTLRSAAMMPTAAASVRARSASGWGSVAADAGDWPTAAAGFAEAIALLARVASRRLARSDQEYWLTTLAGLGAQAAACCLQAGQVDRAVELWDQGRGVLLGQILDSRTDLVRLAEQSPQAAAEFERLRDELDDVTDPRASSVTVPGSPVAAGPAGTDRLRKLAADFERSVARIRDLPGFDRFLLPLPVAEMLRVADHGPVVLVNVADIRSDALLLTRGGVVVVPLPAVTPESVRDRARAFLVALDTVQNGAAGPRERSAAEDELARILAWLWDTIAGPVLQRLGVTGPPHGSTSDGEWPRLWWCPSGLLALLPLHAAGRHATRSGAVADTVLDRVASSYTPTVRALAHARRPLPDGGRDRFSPGAERLLVVSMSRTPGASELPGAAAEARALAMLFPGRTTTLSGRKATHDSVAAALDRFRWAHFACHASSDPTDPSASHLLLHDHQRTPLTVLDLSRLRLEDGELAFLSACATARTPGWLADEAIQLASGCQLAGYRQVIATLWPIGDRAAVQIATDFYGTLRENGAGTAALALHHAVRRRRRLEADRPSSWAAHIHNGA